MGIKERRQREREELRQRILDAARQLFVRDGYEAVTMRSLARAIEYSPTAIYLHFRDKEALFYELCALDMQYLDESMRAAAESVSDPVASLRLIGHAYVKFALEHPGQYQLLFLTQRPRLAASPDLAPAQDGKLPAVMHNLSPDLTDPELKAYENLRRHIGQLIELKMTCSDITSADLLAQAYWCGLHGIVAAHIAICQSKVQELWKSPELLVSFYIDTLLRGILRPEHQGLLSNQN